MGADGGKDARGKLRRIVAVVVGELHRADDGANLHFERPLRVIRGNHGAHEHLVRLERRCPFEERRVLRGGVHHVSVLVDGRRCGDLEGAVKRMTLVVRVEIVTKRLARGRLEVRVDGRRDGIPATGRAVLLEVMERPSRDLDNLGRELLVLFHLGRDLQRLAPRGGVLRVVEEAFVVHLAEHEGATRERLGDVLARGVGLGTRDEPREQRSLRDAHVLGRFPEVVARRLLDPVAPVPEVDVVQIELEDVVLLQLLLQASREQRLADLASVGTLRVEEEVLDHLLRDGGAPLLRAAGAQVDDERAEDAVVVEPLVLVETRVLGGEHRQLHVGWERRDGDHRAALGEKLGEQGAVARKDTGHLRRVVVAAEVRNAGEPLFEVTDREQRADGSGACESDRRDEQRHEPASQEPLHRGTNARRAWSSPVLRLSVCARRLAHDRRR